MTGWILIVILLFWCHCYYNYYYYEETNVRKPRRHSHRSVFTEKNNRVKTLTNSWSISPVFVAASERKDQFPMKTKANLSLPISVILDYRAEQDPYLSKNELEMKWMSTVQWNLQREVLASELCAYDSIVFENVDTIGEIYLNRVHILSTRSAYLTYRYPLARFCTGFAVKQNNNLTDVVVTILIKVTPSLQYAAQQVKKYAPYSYPHTQNYQAWTEPSHRNLIRKPASDFGWDWGPAFPDVKLKMVKLERGLVLDHVAIDYLFLNENKLSEQVKLVVSFDLHNGNNNVIIILRCVIKQNNRTIDEAEMKIQQMKKPLQFVFHLKNVTLWYPERKNELYEAHVSVKVEGEEDLLFTLKKKFGFRKVFLNYKKFELFLNNERNPIKLKGTNVIPADAFDKRAGGEVYRKLIAQARKMNQNTLRVWGGGYFPPPEFYEMCDEHGVLIWQDLPFACAVYPAEEEFLSLIKQETVQFVRGFQLHPSIVIIGGNNEVEASFDWFFWTRVFRAKYESEYVELFLKTILPIVQEVYRLNPIVYLDSSPSNGLKRDGKTKLWGNVNDPKRGDLHYYNYEANCEDAATYPKGMMVSEHGVQSLSWLLVKYVGKSDELSDIVNFRMRHENGFQQIQRRNERIGWVARNRSEGASYFTQVMFSQFSQARCLRTAIEAWRFQQAPVVNNGILIWQLNDVFPGHSWSLLEYDLSWKPGAYQVKKSFSKKLVRLIQCESFVCGMFLNEEKEEEAIVDWSECFVDVFDWRLVEDGDGKRFFFDCHRLSSPVMSNTSNSIIAFHTNVFYNETQSYRVRLITKHGEQVENVLLNVKQYNQEIHKTPHHSTYSFVGDDMCTILIHPVHYARAHVWLYNEGDTVFSFSDNNLLILPNEVVKIHLHPCVRLDFAQIKIVSLNNLLF